MEGLLLVMLASKSYEKLAGLLEVYLVFGTCLHNVIMPSKDERFVMIS
ncbi:hypothetical protein [Streptococcus himalayensis]|nr:hypothetical protein [Streptococcus himalayensis]